MHSWLLLGCLLSCWSLEIFSQTPVGILTSDDKSEVVGAFRYGLSYALKVRNPPIKWKRLHESNAYETALSICRLFYSGVGSFFSLTTSSTINTFKSFSSTFHLPFITSAPAINTTNQQHQFFIRPFYVRALYDLMRHYQWQDVYYFYTTREGLNRLQQLLDVVALDGYMMKTHVFQVDNADSFHNILDRLDSQQAVNKKLLLDLPIKECQRVIEKEFDKTSSQGIKHSFMLVGLGMNEIVTTNVFKGGGLNVTGLSFVDFNNKTVKSFMKQHSKNMKTTDAFIPIELALVIEAGMLMGSALMEFSKKHQRLNDSVNCDSDPILPWFYGNGLARHMRKMNLQSPLTGNIRFDEFGLRRDYKLDIMEVSLNRGLAKIGVWESRGGLKIQQPTMIRQKGYNTIANKTRTITSIYSAPHLMLVEDEEELLEGNDMFEGYCADLGQRMSEIIGFDFVIKPVNDSKYGDNKTGTWDGMVGELLSGVADLAIAPLTITADRESVIDFSKPFMKLGISIMIKKPSKKGPSVFSFLNPLSYEVWMCVIFAYIGVSVVLFLVSRFSPFEWHMEDNQEGMVNNFTIFNSLWFSLGAFMQQGVDIEPRSMSGRIVGSVWWFFTLILISSYTANLAAFLTSERMQSPVESAEDLAKQTEIKYGTVAGGSSQDFFRKSTIPTFERMWAFMSSSDPWVFVKSTDEGVETVRRKNGKYAFLTESTQNEYTNQRLPCDTMKVGGNLDAKGYGIGTPMGSDLRDRITLAVLELTESGELDNLEKKWWYEKGECMPMGNPKKQEATSSLKLSNVAGIFFILIGGLVLSLIIAAIEFFHKNKIDANRKKSAMDKAMIDSGGRLSLIEASEEDNNQADAPSQFLYPAQAQAGAAENYVDSNMHTQV